LTLSSPSWAASGNLSAGTCNFACWHCSDKIHCGLNGSFPVELSLGSQIVPCGEALRHPQVPGAPCWPTPEESAVLSRGFHTVQYLLSDRAWFKSLQVFLGSSSANICSANLSTKAGRLLD
ncbi:Hypothetical predicted protein, partial [Podarcis lilfordi]